MNIYMAAVYSNGYRAGGNTARYQKLNDHEKVIVGNLSNILESYHYVQKTSYVNAMKEDRAKIFLDSGAFSAFNLNVTINLESYCNYIKENMDIIRMEDNVVMASVLDGIGDPLQTWRNQLEMEARGVRPLPCFHAGEDERYLEHYVKNYEYITLGGLVGSSTKQLMIWLDRMWNNYLIDGSGRPRLKVHGFGITSIPLMERYPWESVDSSSWIHAASFGLITTAKFGLLSISTKSPTRHNIGQHVSTLTPIEQDHIFEYLETNGFTFERLSTVYESRAAFNLWSYGVIQTMMRAANNYEVFKQHTQELF